MNSEIIKIYIGYDYRERAATNVLIDSLYHKSSLPVSITPLVTSQLKNQGLYNRERDPKQSTDFSFTRFLVPYLQNYEGWAIFMDCDMLLRGSLEDLWKQRNNKFAVMCKKHNHTPSEKIKFQGEIQTSYPKKNWSSLILFNCAKCKALTLEKVNRDSGLNLHRFNWLSDEKLIGEIQGNWNYLIDVDKNQDFIDETNPNLVHWTLGGPWFKEQRLMGGALAAEWFAARDKSIELWD